MHNGFFGNFTGRRRRPWGRKSNSLIEKHVHLGSSIKLGVLELYFDFK